MVSGGWLVVAFLKWFFMAGIINNWQFTIINYQPGGLWEVNSIECVSAVRCILN